MRKEIKNLLAIVAGTVLFATGVAIAIPGVIHRHEEFVLLICCLIAMAFAIAGGGFIFFGVVGLRDFRKEEKEKEEKSV